MKTFSFYAIIVLLLYSCKFNASSESTEISDSTLVVVEDTIPPEPPKPEIAYSALRVKGKDSAYQYIHQRITGDSLVTLLQINRIDKKFIRNLDTIVIPSEFTGNLLDYAPFPSRLNIIKEVDKMFFFAYPIQAYAVYEKGKLIKWGASSMGKQSTKTPTGLNFTNWRGRKINSSVNSSWILEYNFNIMNFYGVGWHKYDLPGYPASHACLRLFMDDAKWLYDYADAWVLENGQLIANGNPVIVFGDYPWGERKPWLNLIEDPHANDISEEEMNEIIQPELEKIMAEQSKRADVLERKRREKEQKEKEEKEKTEAEQSVI